MIKKSALPQISIITVTYNLIKNNRKDFFLKCVNSIKEQTYKNIEYIIIDGASSDGTLKLFSEMIFPKNTTIISEPDSGMWNAMNKGIKKANGKYICFLNSDDFYVTNTIIAECIKKLEETNNDYSIANFMAIKKNGEVINEWCKNIKPLPREFFYRRMTYNHETLICRKDIYEKLGFHNEKYKTAADYYFNTRLVFAGCSSVYIDKVMIAARAGGETTNSEGEVSNSALTDISNLWNNMYPWCVFTPEVTNNILSYNIFPQNCLKKIKDKIIAMQLKNFNYSVFIKDIDLLIEHQENKSFFSPSSCVKYKKIYLFGIILIFKIRKSEKKVKFSLFSFIPLLKIQYKNTGKFISLFGFIPLLKIKEKNK